MADYVGFVGGKPISVEEYINEEHKGKIKCICGSDIHRQFRICQIGEYNKDIRINGFEKRGGYVNIIYKKPIENNEDLDE